MAEPFGDQNEHIGPKRPAPAKEGHIQRTDFYGDGTSETPKAAYRIIEHII